MGNIHQRDLVKFLLEAYNEAFNSDTISSGFSKAGLVPFNPLKVLRQCEDWNDRYLDFVPKLDNSEKSLDLFVQIKGIMNLYR